MTTQPLISTNIEIKQTAIRWLIEQVKSPEWQDYFIWNKEEAFKQALAMEKQQIIVSYLAGDCQNQTAEQFYKESFGIPQL